MKSIIIFLLLTGTASAYQDARRTASWYAAHPDVAMRVLSICRDDPGHTRRNPDCINAEQGALIMAQREAVSAADLTPPTSPKYWQMRPLERHQELVLCDKMRPEDQAAFFCDAARRGQ